MTEFSFVKAIFANVQSRRYAAAFERIQMVSMD
jgi:hypothetical protein